MSVKRRGTCIAVSSSTRFERSEGLRMEDGEVGERGTRLTVRTKAKREFAEGVRACSTVKILVKFCLTGTNMEAEHLLVFLHVCLLKLSLQTSAAMKFASTSGYRRIREPPDLQILKMHVVLVVLSLYQAFRQGEECLVLRQLRIIEHAIEFHVECLQCVIH